MAVNDPKNPMSLIEARALVASGDKETAKQCLSKAFAPTSTDIDRREWAILYREVELFEKALSTLDQIVDPNESDIIDKGICTFMLGNKSDAIKYFETSLLLKETSRAYYLISVVMADGKNPYAVSKDDKAKIILLLTKATNLEQCGENTFLELDKYLHDPSDESKSKRYDNLKNALSKHAENRSIRLRYAEFLRYPMGNPKESLEVLTPLLNKQDARASWLAYEAAKDTEDFAGALSFIQDIKPINSDSMTIDKVKGDLFLKLKDYDSAVQCFNREISCKKDNERKVVGLFSRAYSNLLRGDVTQASKDVTNAAKLCFELELGSFHGSKVAVSEEFSDYYSVDETIVSVCEAFLCKVDISPIKKDSEAFGQLCYIFSKYRSTEFESEQESDSESNFWLERATEIISHPLISKDLSDEFYFKNEFVQAIEHHLKYALWKYKCEIDLGIEVKTRTRFYSCDDENISKANTLSIFKVFKKSLDAQLTISELMPVFVEVYSSTISNLLHKAGMFKEILKLTEILVEHTEDTSVWFDFAYSNSSLGNKELAESAYRHYLEINPESSSVLHNLSILVEKANLKEAIELSEKAFLLSPKDEIIKNRFDKFKPSIQFKVAAESSLKSPVKFESLELKDRIYLGAVLNACLSEDQKIIYSVREVNKRLGPGADFEIKILNHLWQNDILIVDPYSNITALSLSADGKCSADLRQARWILNVKASKKISHAKILTELIQPDLVDAEHLEEATALWSEVALEEGLEYLQYKRASVNLSAEVSEKTREYFIELLQKYSTAQIYNIVWNSVKNAVMFQREKGMSNVHAANMVASGCKQYGDKAAAEGWDLKPYRRNYDLTQSVISELLYNKLLGIGEAGFNNRPGSYPENILSLDSQIN